MNSAINIQGSIRRRLLLTLLGGALVLAIILFLVFRSLSTQLAEESQDNILRASATAILDSASVNQGELDLDLPYSAFSMLSNVTNDSVYYAVHANGEFLTGYDDLPIDTAPAQPAPWFLTTQYRGDAIRLVSMSRVLSIGDNPVRLIVAVAQTQGGQSEVMARVLRIAALVGAGVFLLVVILAILSARTAISPLTRLAASVERRGPKELRPVAAPVPVEMAPLVTSLNSFMERLNTSLTRTEEFIADAAHRLRTPLAIVRTRAEATLLRVDKEENRAALKDMIRAIDESSRAAGQMLDHAMVTLRTDDLERTEFDLSQLIDDMVERMSPMAELRDISIETVLPEKLALSGDPVLFQSALRNILDNALKFSPVEGTITVEAISENGYAEVQIRDNGKGFPEGDVERLKGRYTRGDNAAGIVGSGLGLTIATDVAQAHGGSLAFPVREGEGACVVFSVPLS
ncbi:sensor histidine kinase [uncultured Hoeflea sp.]|uniref:sensor histidine kinase n=1 Tax=uncultured Hoeflea sp. TaxID=538666 RepID=UPI0026112DB4|nr:sensor histidine kinase [uncultured Hoeflea sp.]